MYKKVLLITLITASIFVAGCSNKQTTQPVSKNMSFKVNSNSSSNSNTTVNSNTENNAATVQNEESFYGQWVIEKAVGYCRAGTYSSDDIKKIIGKKLSFSKEQSSCFGDDASYLNNTVKNPTYKKSVITADQFLDGWRVSISTLTINSNAVTQIQINDEKNFPACTFFIKDNNTLILYGGGTFFELSRITS